jgi:hypothetical protein
MGTGFGDKTLMSDEKMRHWNKDTKTLTKCERAVRPSDHHELLHGDEICAFLRIAQNEVNGTRAEASVMPPRAKTPLTQGIFLKHLVEELCYRADRLLAKLKLKFEPQSGTETDENASPNWKKTKAASPAKLGTPLQATKGHDESGKLLVGLSEGGGLQKDLQNLKKKISKLQKHLLWPPAPAVKHHRLRHPQAPP